MRAGETEGSGFSWLRRGLLRAHTSRLGLGTCCEGAVFRGVAGPSLKL